MSNPFSFLAPRDCERPYTISEINNGIASVIESGNTLVWIEGEISNWRPSSSGHSYFRLKDAGSQIPAVIWRSTAGQLSFRPADGMAVMAVASIRVYQKGGYYQLDVHRMQPLGEGALHLAFQKLKAKLEREGLFDATFKKQLPLSIRRIGVVTSKNGAAIKDIVRIIAKRAPQTEIILRDVPVQGDTAAGKIASAIEDFNNCGIPVDCIIAGRGGGSIEDLWAFNEEVVARAIFTSTIPVISAVGHEIDFTIADFVADVRAATPSAAAEIAVGDTGDLQKRLSVIAMRFRNGTARKFDAAHADLSRLRRQAALRTPWRKYLEARQASDDSRSRIERQFLLHYRQKMQRLSLAARQLGSLNPLSVLGRGYSVVSRKDGTVVRTADQVDPGDQVDIRFSGGSAEASINAVSRNSD
ncbi:MAG: exodeoxyribonuclease VII large subunit [Chitinispirillaceae bacterium]|nr:exodeoxyribonuclease VII large subunit [Chitinispirillaceae bacterium]